MTNQTANSIHTTWAGVWPALVTPFQPNGSIDLASLQRQIRQLKSSGVTGVVALGTTGEAAALSATERDLVISTAVDTAEGLPVVVGTGTNNSLDTCRRTARAQELGAFAAMVVTPYYVRPNPRGLLGHYQAVADAVGDFPVLQYNVPGRTGLHVNVEQTLEIVESTNVTAVKEAGGDLELIASLSRGLGSAGAVLSGDDHLTCAAVALGAVGVVSVAANVLPDAMVRLVAAALKGEVSHARDLHEQLAPLMSSLFCESNPVPVKAALALLGHADPAVRLPLAPASRATRERLRSCLTDLGLLEDAA